jgi:hypothetical protein
MTVPHSDDWHRSDLFLTKYTINENYYFSVYIRGARSASVANDR